MENKVYIIDQKENTTIHAMCNSNIIGFLSYTIIDNKKDRQIVYLYVDGHYRRKGIASKLISYIIENSGDANYIYLWTGKEIEINELYTIYEKFGFKQHTILEDYYGDRIPLRLFCKTLK